MASFAPDPQPTNVGPSGVTVPVTIPEGYRHRRIQRIAVDKTAGSATTYDAAASTDATFMDDTQTIISMSGGNGASLDYDNGGSGYEWDHTLSNGVVHVFILPNTGTDNDFHVRIYVHRGGT